MLFRLKKAVSLIPLFVLLFTLTGCDKPWNVRLQGTVVSAEGGPLPGLSANLCYRVSEQIRGCSPIKTDSSGAFFLDKSGESDLSHVQAQIKKENFYLKLSNGAVVPAEVLQTRSLVANSDGVKASLLGLFRMPSPQQPAPPPVIVGGSPGQPATPIVPQQPAAPVQETWIVKFDGTVLDAQGAPLPGLSGDMCYRVADEIKGCLSITTDADGRFHVEKNGTGAVPSTSVQRLNFYVRSGGEKIAADKIETVSLTHDGGVLAATLNGVYKKEAPDTGDPTAALQHQNPNDVVALLDLSGPRLHSRSVATGQQNGAVDANGVDGPAAHAAGAAI